MRRDLALAGIVGALSARPRHDLQASYPQLTPLGLPGCRAPDRRFSVTVPAWPPSKSNTYKVVRTRGRDGVPHARLAAGEAVISFESLMADAIARELDRLRYRMAWFTNPPVKAVNPINPLFGADCEVSLLIVLSEPWRTNRDTDNVGKIVGDVLTSMGIWFDDVQVGDQHTLRAVGYVEQEETRVTVEWHGLAASWTVNPGQRPVSTAQLRKLGLPPAFAQARHEREATARMQRHLASMVS